MSEITLILRNSLFYGAILSAFLSLLIIGSLYYNAEMWAGDYPPDIKKKFGPISDKAKRQQIIISIPFFGALIVSIVLANLRLQSVITYDLAFWMLFLNSFIVVMTFNLVDLLILDGLLLVIRQPDFAILPGTEGMAGYKDFGFHVRGFLVGTVLSLIAGLIAAGIGIAIQSLT
jgi:hypothetical protein